MSLNVYTGKYVVYTNICILATQALFEMEFSVYTDKITYCFFFFLFLFLFFSHLIPKGKKMLSLNLNKGFIEPLYTCRKQLDNGTYSLLASCTSAGTCTSWESVLPLLFNFMYFIYFDMTSHFILPPF